MKIIELEEKLMKGHKPDYQLPSGCYIAGGAIRCWFTGEDINDIDIFCKDENTIKEFIKINQLTEKITDKPLLLEYKSSKGAKIQIIKIYKNSIEELFNSFDYTICQFGYDGTKIYSTSEAITSTLRKHLGVAHIQPGYEVDSLRRMIKYTQKGYIPCIGTIQAIAHAIQNINDEKEIDNQISISPGGGKRVHIRWD